MDKNARDVFGGHNKGGRRWKEEGNHERGALAKETVE
jgi:hypothetical protein